MKTKNKILPEKEEEKTFNTAPMGKANLPCCTSPISCNKAQ